jgi:hypothetical protein
MIKKAISILVILLLHLATYAQVINPCEGADADSTTCPLDTWVYILVIAAVIYGAYRMYKKQRSIAI